MSTDNHKTEMIIAMVKGIHKTLYEKDKEISPFIKESVALPIPQPGQGIPVINLNKQNG